MQRTCDRVRMKRSYRRFGCCFLSAVSITFRLHIVHLATDRALADLRAARTEGLPVSVETCPHYLHLTAETIADGATLCKCAPPVRSRENRERLWEGLAEGVIDLVATDHSPCPPSMKQLESGNFKTAWGGISSLSMALPVMWTEASQRGFTLADIARWMSEGPARLAGCESRNGRIAAGYDADFVVFDPEAEFAVTTERLHHRHAVSPYLGEKLRGVVKATYLRGRAVFSGWNVSGVSRSAANIDRKPGGSIRNQAYKYLAFSFTILGARFFGLSAGFQRSTPSSV